MIMSADSAALTEHPLGRQHPEDVWRGVVLERDAVGVLGRQPEDGVALHLEEERGKCTIITQVLAPKN